LGTLKAARCCVQKLRISVRRRSGTMARCTAGRLEHGLDLLAPVVVGDAEDGDVADLGMAAQTDSISAG
jgi:hypothetical protein